MSAFLKFGSVVLPVNLDSIDMQSSEAIDFTLSKRISLTTGGFKNFTITCRCIFDSITKELISGDDSNFEAKLLTIMEASYSMSSKEKNKEFCLYIRSIDPLEFRKLYIINFSTNISVETVGNYYSMSTGISGVSLGGQYSTVATNISPTFVSDYLPAPGYTYTPYPLDYTKVHENQITPKDLDINKKDNNQLIIEKKKYNLDVDD